ncbi:MAG TPA: extracellular solute-binding protein, partial [Clostridia bacterium]|nr:extracellular solute-binding protein [Clostridia bacterium]
MDHRPNQGYQEKKNVLLASGKYPDFFYRAGLSVADLINYGGRGAFIELNALIEENAPNFMERAAEYPSVIKEITMPNGKIYSMPIVEPSPTRGERSWMNKRWLENVGMEAPTTVEELEAVLLAFKTQDANGNGDLNDEIPYSDRASGSSIFQGTYSAFGIGNLGYGGFANYVDLGADGKVRFFATSEDFLRQLTWIRGLYDQGLLDMEMFTQDIPTFTAKGEQDQIGAFFHNGNPEIIGAKNMYDFVNIGPMANVDTGERVYNNIRSMCGVGAFAISNTNPYPEATVRWVDYWYSHEGDRL